MAPAQLEVGHRISDPTTDLQHPALDEMRSAIGSHCTVLFFLRAFT